MAAVGFIDDEGDEGNGVEEGVAGGKRKGESGAKADGGKKSKI